MMVVDTGAGIDQTVQTFVAACQIPVLVVCDEPASLTTVMRSLKYSNLVKILSGLKFLLIRLIVRLREKSL